jgi:uncharacterized protein YecE (DUF72 family)
MMLPIIGTAGWSIPTQQVGAFPAEGSSLERYASRFRGVEINSSFHRPHRLSTWTRWGESVPDEFLFSVKVPKLITHQRRLVDCEPEAAEFLRDASGLAPKLAVLLVQLPPSLVFDAAVVAPFFAMLRSMSCARLACEPRHPSWFEKAADTMLRTYEVARVAADPARVPLAAVPGGWRGLSYWRLHGSPIMYRSAYGLERLAAYSASLGREVAEGQPVWCIFDNTASSAATDDALKLRQLLGDV